MNATGKIHAGTCVKPGDRYDRVIKFLRSRGQQGATGLEIESNCRVRAASTLLSELRSMGYDVPAGKYEGRTEQGGKVWRYWLLGGPVALPAAPPPPAASTPQPTAPQPPPGELFARTG